MAVVEGAKILRKHLNPFIQYAEPGPEIGIAETPDLVVGGDQVDHELERKLNMSLAELELSVRATNCLESEGITTVRDLVIRTDEELLEVRNFGETTLKEVKQKLAERGMQLGMKLPASLRR
jgi:DNA-directed RNA polymerase subunit alpha